MRRTITTGYSRSKAWTLFGLVLVSMLVISSSPQPEVDANNTALTQTEPPNIVFILTDDLTERDVKYMPNVRRLIRDQGISFDNAFVTTSICCPSRSSTLTGRYTHNHRIFGNWEPYGGAHKFRRLGWEKKTVAKWLDDAGYKTMLAGKYLNAYGTETGAYVPEGWDKWYAATGLYRYSENGTFKSYDPDGFNNADYIRNKALKFRKDDPFFQYISTHAPHLPHQVKPVHAGKFVDKYAPRDGSYNERDLRDKPRWVQRRAYGRAPVGRMTKQQRRRIDQDYRDRLRALQPVDEMVKAIVRDLRSSGELDNTYIFFTSDNGYKHGQHRQVGKWTAYEEDIGVPLFVRGPGVPKGVERSQMALNTDLAPTFADLAGARRPNAVDGRSLAPLLTANPPSKWRSRFLVESYRSEFPKGRLSRVPTYQGVRTTRFLYTEHKNGARVTDRELYNLRRDPYQLNSIHRTKNRRLVLTLDRQLNRLSRCRGEECRSAEGR